MGLLRREACWDGWSTMRSELLSTGLSLIGLQLISRLLTFILNQALVRLASPEALGTSSIQLEVLINTVLFFSREGVRGALSRVQHEFSKLSNSGLVNQQQPIKGKPLPTTRLQQIINACFLPIPAGLIVSTVLFAIYGFTVDVATANQPHFRTALLLYYLAALSELVSEPAYIHLILTGQTTRRIKIEGTAVTLRTFSTLAIVVFGYRTRRDWALLGFAFGQFVYALSLAIGFWYSHLAPHSKQLPMKVVSINKCADGRSQMSSIERWVGKSDLNLCYALTRQSVVKQFLTEGDKMIIARICPIAHQGGYALAMNYGSLVARILFQPIEETSRLYFSKNLAASTLAATPERPSADASAQESLRGAVDLLSSLLYCYAFVGLVFVTFGPPFVWLGLLLLLGPRAAYLVEGAQSTVVNVLRAYCNLLPLLGLNGILEAFVQSAANEAELNEMSKLMAVWCAMFVGAVAVFSSSWAASSLGLSPEVGMVLATGVNMSCRIAYGCWFMGRYIRRRSGQFSLFASIPSMSTICGFMGAAIAVRWSEARSPAFVVLGEKAKQEKLWNAIANHLLIGITCFGGCGFLMLIIERKRLEKVFSTISRRPKTE